MITWQTDTIGVFLSAVNIGITQINDTNYLVDTGIDNSAINKVLKNLDRSVSGALITHHHADHMGGCSKLSNLGLNEFFIPPGEIELFTNPTLEPYSMFGGGWPPKTLRNRHLEAKSIKSSKSLKNWDSNIDISCPGHTPDHTAYLIDDILFSGDAAFTSETINKYKLLFAINPQTATESAKQLKKIDFSVMIPGHGPIAESKSDAYAVLDATIEHYAAIRETIIQTIGEKIPYNSYIDTMMQELNLLDIIKNRGVLQYFLYQAPLFGYLSNLLDDKIVQLIATSRGIEIVTI